MMHKWLLEICIFCLDRSGAFLIQYKPMDGLDVYRYDEPNYRRMFGCNGWRVAILNHGKRFCRRKTIRLERHLLTDEAFVLLSGSAVLMIGREAGRVPMMRECVYNVAKGTWHQVETSPGTKILIVENDDTGPDNTEYLHLTGMESGN